MQGGENTGKLAIADSDFDCVLDMQGVRGFYVDNLIGGELAETVAAPAAATIRLPLKR